MSFSHTPLLVDRKAQTASRPVSPTHIGWGLSLGLWLLLVVGPLLGLPGASLSPLASAQAQARIPEPTLRSTPRDEAWLKEDLARLAQNPKDPFLMREAAISLNVVGAPDNWPYLQKSRALLEEANKLEPNNPHILMFLGSTIAMLARHPDVGLFDKKSMVTSAFEYMDKAIELEPDSYRLRLMRGTANLGAPSFFGRSKELEADVALIRKTLELAPPADYPGHMKAAGYLLLGSYHEKKGELNRAQAYWSKAIQHGKGTRYETQARKRLQNVQAK